METPAAQTKMMIVNIFAAMMEKETMSHVDPTKRVIVNLVGIMTGAMMTSPAALVTIHGDTADHHRHPHRTATDRKTQTTKNTTIAVVRGTSGGSYADLCGSKRSLRPNKKCYNGILGHGMAF